MISEKKALKEELLSVQGLVSGFETDMGLIRAVDGISFEIKKGKTYQTLSFIKKKFTRTILVTWFAFK